MDATREAAGNEERLAGTAPDRPAGPDDWQRLAALEAEAWRALADSDAEAGEDGLSHPARGPLLAWRAALERAGLPERAREAGLVAADLDRRQLEAWLERVGRPDEQDGAEDWFTALEGLALAERQVPDACAALGEGERPDALRAHLRAGFLSACGRTAPSAWTRRRWADVLIDDADEALAQLDDLSPRRAQELLHDVAGRLDWHLAHVETSAGRERSRLERRRARLRAEGEERRLDARLEKLFGRKAVEWWDRGIVLAIVAALVVLALSLRPGLDEASQHALLKVDTALCAWLLWDFLVKAVLAGWSLSWLKRHVWIDLLPALPFGLAVLLPEGDLAEQGTLGVVALRFLRLPQLARSVRPLLPLLRGLRAIGFLLRGSDRLVRSYGHLLDRDVILYPTPGERRRARSGGGGRRDVWLRRAELDRAWEELLQRATPEQRDAVARARLDELRGITLVPPRGNVGHARSDLCVEELLERLATVPAAEIEGELGPTFVQRLGRGLRALAYSPLRWLPLLAPLVPRGKDLSDAERSAAFTRALSRRLRGVVDVLHWFADLYGTLTPADLVGRVGVTLVRRTSRPAIRLLGLAAVYGVLAGTAALFGLEFGDWTKRVSELIGTTLLVLGSVCFLLLGLGFWMQRLASDASAFYEQVAAAQFTHLTESIKARHLERDARLLDERVFAPERGVRPTGAAPEPEPGPAPDRARFLDGLRAFLTEGEVMERSCDGFDAVARCVLLYRDVLDGALLGESDTRATSQLLGNQAVDRARRRSWTLDATQARAITRIDLVRRRAWVGGPYLWFNLIARATTQEAARLIVDYGEHAVPLDEERFATPAERARSAHWLGEDAAPAGAGRDDVDPRDRVQLSTAFTALHFLDDSPERDDAVAARFGPRVLAHLRRDRRALFRRIFGTYPLHLKPAEERVLNLREAYRAWIEGGRVVLLPFRILAVAIRQTWRAIGFVADAVGRIRNPRLARREDERVESDFHTALRKIDRMRGPAAWASMRQRVWIDGEYLGLGQEDGNAPIYRDDADFLMLRPDRREELEREREGAERDQVRLAAAIEDGLHERLARRLSIDGPLDPVRLRALRLCVRADLDGARSHLFADRLLDEAVDVAARTELERRPPPRALARPRWRLRRVFARFWRERGRGGRRARLAAWRAIARGVDGADRALWAFGMHGGAVGERGEELLADLLRHPGQLSEMLVTLRAVQTLTLIDLANYRGHVFRMGGFAASGDAPPPALVPRGDGEGGDPDRALEPREDPPPTA